MEDDRAVIRRADRDLAERAHAGRRRTGRAARVPPADHTPHAARLHACGRRAVPQGLPRPGPRPCRILARPAWTPASGGDSGASLACAAVHRKVRKARLRGTVAGSWRPFTSCGVPRLATERTPPWPRSGRHGPTRGRAGSGRLRRHCGTCRRSGHVAIPV